MTPKLSTCSVRSSRCIDGPLLSIFLSFWYESYWSISRHQTPCCFHVRLSIHVFRFCPCRRFVDRVCSDHECNIFCSEIVISDFWLFPDAQADIGTRHRLPATGNASYRRLLSVSTGNISTHPISYCKLLGSPLIAVSLIQSQMLFLPCHSQRHLRHWRPFNHFNVNSKCDNFNSPHRSPVPILSLSNRDMSRNGKPTMEPRRRSLSPRRRWADRPYRPGLNTLSISAGIRRCRIYIIHTSSENVASPLASKEGWRFQNKGVSTGPVLLSGEASHQLETWHVSDSLRLPILLAIILPQVTTSVAKGRVHILPKKNIRKNRSLSLVTSFAYCAPPYWCETRGI